MRNMQVRRHRKQYRERRADMLLPVISLVGYTNAGAHATADAVLIIISWPQCLQ